MAIRFSRAQITRTLLILFALALLPCAHAMGQISTGKVWNPAVAKWGPVGCYIASSLLLIGAIFWPWLSKGKLPSTQDSQSGFPCGRWEVILLVVIMAITGWANFPRMHHPLWGDEERSMRNYMIGQYKPTDNGHVKWRDTTIGSCLWDYQSPNNHGFYSLLARVAHGGRQDAKGPLDLPFKEWKLRLPAFLGGLLGLGVVWMLMRKFGFGIGAWVAVLVMAAHPWFVKYSTEARGYGLVYLLWPLAMYAAVSAVQTGKWRWWIALGVLQAMLFWTWMLQLHWLLALNLSIVVQMLRAGEIQEGAQPRRWLVAGSITAIILLPLQLPAFMQVKDWIAKSSEASMPRAKLYQWVSDALSTLLSGELWHSADPGNPLCPARLEQWHSNPVLVILIFLLPTVVFITGLLVWLKKPLWAWLPAMLLPLFLVFAQSLMKGSVLLPWYASPLLPMTAMLMGAGAENLAGRTMKFQIPAALILTVLIVLPGQRLAGLVRSHPMEDNMAATLLTRSCINPKHPDFGKDSITAQPIFPRFAYDPLAHKAEKLEDLHQLLQSAEKSGLPLFVHIGNPPFLGMRNPAMMTLLENPEYFTKIAEFPGMDAPQRRVVWKWTRRMPPTP